MTTLGSSDGGDSDNNKIVMSILTSTIFASCCFLFIYSSPFSIPYFSASSLSSSHDGDLGDLSEVVDRPRQLHLQLPVTPTQPHVRTPSGPDGGHHGVSPRTPLSLESSPTSGAASGRSPAGGPRGKECLTRPSGSPLRSLQSQSSSELELLLLDPYPGHYEEPDSDGVDTKVEGIESHPSPFFSTNSGAVKGVDEDGKEDRDARNSGASESSGGSAASGGQLQEVQSILDQVDRTCLLLDWNRRRFSLCFSL
jgi:hypothetical protein